VSGNTFSISKTKETICNIQLALVQKINQITSPFHEPEEYATENAVTPSADKMVNPSFSDQICAISGSTGAVRRLTFQALKFASIDFRRSMK